VVCLPGLVRIVRRRSRLQALRSGKAGPLTAWREISDAAQDHGIPVSDVDTPRAFAAVLADRSVATARESDALAELLDAVEHVRFANPERLAGGLGGPTLAASTELLNAAIRRNSTRADQVRATIAPASVLSPSRARFRAEPA
ncbi:MAG: DUF4129 domain-containing protein, partial [Mycetocola sp.]